LIAKVKELHEGLESAKAESSAMKQALKRAEADVEFYKEEMGKSKENERLETGSPAAASSPLTKQLVNLQEPNRELNCDVSPVLQRDPFSYI